MPPRGGRSTSRKDTPVSPRKAAPAAARRSTRSQSQDIEPRNNAETRSTPQPDLESPARRTRSKTNAQGLSTVDEEQAVVHDLQDEDPEESESEQHVEGRDSDALSTGSDDENPYSQRELAALDRTSLVDALPDLYQDSDGVLSLFELEDPARLAEFRRDLRMPNSRLSTTLKRKLSRFEASRESYRPKTYFIDVKLIVRGLARISDWNDIPNEIPRPDAILQLANLVKLIAIPLSADRADDEISEIVESLYKNFPQPYVSNFGSGHRGTEPTDTDLFRETAQLALEIRTQYVISQLARRQDMLPVDIITNGFMDDVDHRSLRGLNLSDDSDTLPKEFHNMFRVRADELLRYSEEEGIEREELEGLYDWEDFLVSLAQWTNSRRRELEAQIEGEGGVDAIQQKLAEYLKANETEAHSEPAPEYDDRIVSKAPAAGNGSNLTGKSSRNPIQKLARSEMLPPGSLRVRNRLSDVRERKTKAAQGGVQEDGLKNVLPPSAQPPAEIPQSPQNSPPPQTGDDDDAFVAPPARSQGVPPLSQAARRVLGTLERQALISNKENIDTSRKVKSSFIDRQANAHRVGWDDSQNAEGERSSGRSGKRRIEEEDEEEDEEAYEEDRRPVKPRSPKRPRRQPPREIRTPPLNDDNIDGGDDEDADQAAINQQIERESQRTPRSPLAIRSNPSPHPRPTQAPPARPRERPNQNPSPRPRERPVQRARSPPNGLPASSQYKTVNRDAKLAAENLRRERPQAPQTRRPYTEEETTRLIELIEEHGTSWALILKADETHEDGPELFERSQVNIKDKARNLKMDYMKSGHRLPNNFAEIKLGTRLESMLQHLGIDVLHYEREQAQRAREEDTDD